MGNVEDERELASQRLQTALAELGAAIQECDRVGIAAGPELLRALPEEVRNDPTVGLLLGGQFV